MDNESLHVAVLLDFTSLQKWQLESLEALVSSDQVNVSIDLVIINTESRQSTFRSQLKSMIFEFSPYKLLVAYRKFYARVRGQPWYRKSISLSESNLFSDVETIKCTPDPDTGFGNTLPDSAINALEQMDLAVRFGFGILKGEALSAPEYGVLSYHHGDLTEYRGRPAGFYEFLHGKKTAGVTIQRLNETLDGGAVAAMSHVNIRSADSWREVQSRLFKEGTDLLPQAVYRCVYEADELNPPKEIGELYTNPSGMQILFYINERLRRTIL